jgi:hypothetical protein
MQYLINIDLISDLSVNRPFIDLLAIRLFMANYLLLGSQGKRVSGEDLTVGERLVTGHWRSMDGHDWKLTMHRLLPYCDATLLSPTLLV